MIESLLFFVLFSAVWKLNNDSTYKILLIASFLAAATYPFGSEYSIVLAASIDLLTGLMLLRFGNKHYWYQVSLIGAAMMCHFYLEFDRYFGTDVIFSLYEESITLITILQLAGGCYGVISIILERLQLPNNRGMLWRYVPNSSYLQGGKACQKAQHKR